MGNLSTHTVPGNINIECSHFFIKQIAALIDTAEGKG